MERWGALTWNRTKPSKSVPRRSGPAGLDELVLEPVEEQVVHVRPGGLPGPDRGDEVAGRAADVGPGESREARLPERRGPRRGPRERGSSERGPARRKTATVAASHATAKSDAPTPASRNHRPK